MKLFYSEAEYCLDSFLSQSWKTTFELLDTASKSGQLDSKKQAQSMFIYALVQNRMYPAFQRILTMSDEGKAKVRKYFSSNFTFPISVIQRKIHFYSYIQSSKFDLEVEIAELDAVFKILSNLLGSKSDFEIPFIDALLTSHLNLQSEYSFLNEKIEKYPNLVKYVNEHPIPEFSVREAQNEPVKVDVDEWDPLFVRNSITAVVGALGITALYLMK